MNPELMIPVEKAVRGVSCSFDRKMRMREELVSLLEMIYAEEKARHADEAAALAAALKRFGDPADLARDLRETVPRFEGAVNPFVERLWAPRPGEAPLRHAARVGAQFLVFMAVLFLVTHLAALPFRGAAALRATLEFSATLCLMFGVFAFGFALFSRALCALLERASGLAKIGGVAAVLLGVSLMMALVGGGLIATTAPDQRALLDFARPWSAVTLAAPILFGVTVWLHMRERRRSAPWRELVLEG